jgi:hypothetical protein
MNELVAWLGEQLDEDERLARAAGEGWYGYDPTQQIAFVPPEDALHIATHSPARVLREIDAKRRTIELCVPPLVDVTGPGEPERSFVPGEGQPWGLDVLKLLVLPYVDRPGYREEWRP